ncbi:hypothetical protein HYE68_009667 [Fusarium pseudograminearum]|nr:hypothetical protein HYE68_009667 [Fusarium pseudograminearum]
MCLPCFPWTWTKVEDPYDEMHKAPDQSVWVHDGQGWELQKLKEAIMASAGANPLKSPKTPRRPKTPESRQVHFEPETKPATTSAFARDFNSGRITGYTSANSPSGGFSAGVNGVSAPKTPPGIKATAASAATATATVTSAPEQKIETQPTNFPALGLGANQLQWHISANPTQSLSHQLPGPVNFISPPPQAHQQHFFSPPQFHPASYISAGPNNIVNPPTPSPSPITYIGIGPQSPALTLNQASNMGDYQNAAPPVHGLHFQPPVPDTTFGPMQHVYVPRHDGGLAGFQVGAPASFNYVSAAPFAIAPSSSSSYTTVVVPKTYYLNGYTYYASSRSWLTQPAIGTMAPQPSAYGGFVVQQQQQPYYVQQPTMGQQPVLIAGQLQQQQQQQFVPQMQNVPGVPTVGLAGGTAVPGTVPVFAGNVPGGGGGGGHIPEVMGVGRTAGEEQLRQIKFAHANKLYEPQEFKPADDDPSRFYYVREVDGNWTQRNRFTIDHMGDSKWYNHSARKAQEQQKKRSLHHQPAHILDFWSKIVLIKQPAHQSDVNRWPTVNDKSDKAMRMLCRIQQATYANMLLIGLTGSIATGKSTVSSMLSSQPYNLPIIDADILARKVVEPGTRGYQAIVKHFGPTTPELLVEPSDKMPENGPNGKGRPLNRPALGRRVFGDSEERKKDRSVLNHIVHPAVRWEMFKSVVGYYFRGHWAVVLDIPLLFESGLDKLCGVAAVVAVRDPAIQMQRLRARDPHLSAEDAENRVRSQTDVREKAQRCEERGEGKGIVLWNDGPREDLQVQLDKAIKGLKKETPDWWTWLLLGCPPLAVAIATWRFWQNLIINERWEEKKLQAKLNVHKEGNTQRAFYSALTSSTFHIPIHPTFSPISKSTQSSKSQKCVMARSRMKSIWDIDPYTSKKKLNTTNFVLKMEGRWLQMITKKDVSEAETQAFKSIIETVTTQTIREISDLPVPSSWAEIIALKILFPGDFFSSEHAVIAQEKFPNANLHQWKLNENGPTPGLDWINDRSQFTPRSLSDCVMRSKTARDTAELKRSRSSEAADDIGKKENPLKKRRLASTSPVKENAKDAANDAVDDTAEDMVKDIEYPIVDPSTSKQATPRLSDDPGDSEDSNEFWSEFGDKLAAVRKAVKEGTDITPRMLNGLRKAHLAELKKQHPDKIFKSIKKQHAQELRNVRARYEGVIATWLKGVASGVRVLQTTRRELSMSSNHEE